MSGSASPMLVSRWPESVRLCGLFAVAALLLAFGSLPGSRADVAASPMTTPAFLSFGSLADCLLHTVLLMAGALTLWGIAACGWVALGGTGPRIQALLRPFFDAARFVPSPGLVGLFLLPLLHLTGNDTVAGNLTELIVVFFALSYPVVTALQQPENTLPLDLELAARAMRLTGWQRFWRLRMPFAIPTLIRTLTATVPGAWFTLAFAETVIPAVLPSAPSGLGACIADAASQRSILLLLATAALMMGVVTLYHHLVFHPLAVWSRRFSQGHLPGMRSETLVLRLFHRVALFERMAEYGTAFFRRLGMLRLGAHPTSLALDPLATPSTSMIVLLSGLLALIAIAFCIGTPAFMEGVTLLLPACGAGFQTLVQIALMVLVASAVWLPLGVWIGLDRNRSQAAMSALTFLSAFPTVLLFPLGAALVFAFSLPTWVGAILLLAAGPQGCIAQALVGGTRNFPLGLLDAARAYNIRGALWWRAVILPGLGLIWLRGAQRAALWGWAVSIAAELTSWGGRTSVAPGLGSFIAEGILKGDTVRVATGMAVMTVFAAAFDLLFWTPLATFVQRRTAGAE